MANSDQHFLLYFIIGIYFGPDMKERPQKSILQRIAEGLPTYTSDQLAGSHMKTVEVERVYYYVLRKAEKSLAVKLPLLQNFFCGTMLTNENKPAAAYPQFPDLFPTQLHPHSRLKNKCKIIENITFINDPDASHIRPNDLERFKRLTVLDNLLLDKVAARFHTFEDGSTLYNVPVHGIQPVGELPPVKPSHSSRRAKRAIGTSQSEDHTVHVVAPLSSVPLNYSPRKQKRTTPPPTRDDTRTEPKVGPAMLLLPFCPNKEEWTNIMAAGKSGLSVGGSAATGQVRPGIGHMNMGESEDSYMFRISLPGVKKDEKDFSCIVDSKGKVVIKGVTTTGEDVVYRFSQKFIMQSKNLGPPGEFSITFHLPGPVNPQQFKGNFTDGILEGIVMKCKNDNL